MTAILQGAAPLALPLIYKAKLYLTFICRIIKAKFVKVSLRVDLRQYIKFLNTVKKLATIAWLLLLLTHYYVIITAQYLHSRGSSVAFKHPEHTQTTGRHVRSDEDGSFAVTKLCKTHTEKY